MTGGGAPTSPRLATDSAPEPVLEHEVLGLQLGERLAQLGELRLGTVHLEPRQIGDLQQLLKQGTDVVEVGEKGSRVPVAFAAMGLIAVEAEAVEENTGLLLSQLDEAVAVGLELGQLARMDLEVGAHRAARVVGRQGSSHSFPGNTPGPVPSFA